MIGFRVTKAGRMLADGLKAGRLFSRIALGQHFMVNWQVTRRCNFDCSICHFGRNLAADPHELDRAGLLKVAHALRPLAPSIISLGGGEPLLRDDLPQLISALSPHHYVCLISNGWLASEALAKELYLAGLGDVHLSLDYCDPLAHDTQRGQTGAFQQVLRALGAFARARPSPERKLRILTVLLDDNVDQLEGLLILAREHQASLALSLYSDQRGRKPSRRPEAAVVDKLLCLKKDYPEFESSRAYLRNFDEALANRAPGNCSAGKFFLDIDHRGRLCRCIDRADSHVGCLTSDSLTQVLARLSREAEREPCGECWTSCRGLADIVGGLSGIPAWPEYIRAALR